MGFGGELYDLAVGPNRNEVPYRSRVNEWDDPTWVAVEIDEGWMAEQNRKARRLKALTTNTPAEDFLRGRSGPVGE